MTERFDRRDAETRRKTKLFASLCFVIAIGAKGCDRPRVAPAADRAMLIFLDAAR